jgi:hypothetical protein
MARGVKVIDKDVTNKKKDEIRNEFFKSSVQQMTAEDLEKFITEQEHVLNIHCRGDKSIALVNCFRLFFNGDEVDQNGFPKFIDLEKVAELHRRSQTSYVEILQHIRRENIGETVTTDVNNDQLRLIDRVGRLIQYRSDAYDQVLLYERQLNRVNNPMVVQSDSRYMCSTIEDTDDMSPYQELLLYLLNKTDKLSMRRYKGYCCQQIGNTRAWKNVQPISEFVYEQTQKETKFDMWKNLTAKSSNTKDVIKHLSDCIDIQFPNVYKNRHVWSFKNGIFIGKLWSQKLNKYTHAFYPYESPAFESLDPTVTSCKYFDQEFPTVEYESWWDIPTPHMQSVMEYQRFPRDVCEWLYVFVGRLMFDVGNMDQWQVIPFLKGIARSGKSTIITKICKKFYDPDDVRTLSNNIERKFGLSSIYDGFMFISPEVKGDLCLEQAEFQSLVSGEDISIARKNEKALSLTWTTPGILAGNEVPGWKDNSGSVLRRIVTWDFTRQVQDADPKLEDKLNDEIPMIMLKCCRAYLEYAHIHSDKDIWTVLPEYFKKVQNQVAMVTNSLHHYLSSEKIKYGPDLMCPQRLFVHSFNAHCAENNLGRFKFNPDFYAGPFSSRDITVKNHTGVYNGKPFKDQPFIIGLDIVVDGPEFSDDY